VYKKNPIKKFSFNNICMFYKNNKYSERISYKEINAEKNGLQI